MGVNWKVEFYNEKVEEQTIAFPKGILADFLRVVELIEEFGSHLLDVRIRPLWGKDYSKLEPKAGKELAGQFSA